ncbi:MAG: ABC transporter substrate-binding protein [Lachnospiraceae bacterium]|nr:ABC transporter substrate-binding protein [Lachnospiraceae bacterium]
MIKLKSMLALIMSAVMICSVPVMAEEATTEAEPAATEQAAHDNFVFATATFGQKFSPFFATTAYDMEVVDLTQLGALAADRGGAIIYNGIEGETINYNGTDYTYYGMGDVTVTQNDDGTVDYTIKIRDNVKFSDGEPVTIDDYIFSFYVLVDPTYDGSSTIYALPIEGMEEYRSGMQSKMALILDTARAGYEENEYYTQEEYDAFWTAFDAAGANFAQEIVDYLVAAGYNTAEDSVATCAANWGYELAEDATTADFFAEMVNTYGYDLSDEGINLETAGTSILEFITAELGDEAMAAYQTGIQTGEGAPNVSGLTRVDDYTVNLHMTEFDATAIYNVGGYLAPLHYYGNADEYDYENNKFGFTKGDLSGVKSVTSKPIGCGPYVFDGYSNGVVTLKANEYYFEGKPVTDVVLMQEAIDSDYVPGIVTGSFDLAVPSINDETLKAIQDANGNGELQGDVLHTILVDYRGYGYLGINADLVNINGEPGSDASKALRKGFMTLFSVYRDTVINSYYGDRASVIQYPISNTSWAAPKPADEGYHAAYSVDVDGNPIYTEGMTEEERYAAAKEAAIGYFKAAGFTYDEAAGKFTDVEQSYEVLIPGAGQQDHPAYGVATSAASVLEELGIKLQVNDVGTDVWNNALEGNTAMMWAAAWQATVDPDMTQVYHSDNAHGNGTNSNHYSVDDEELDSLIKEGRGSADTEYRKSIYKNAMEIIMDWGVELPLYQRKDCTVASAERVVIDSLPHDMTPYWGWYAEINTLELQ